MAENTCNFKLAAVIIVSTSNVANSPDRERKVTLMVAPITVSESVVMMSELINLYTSNTELITTKATGCNQ